MQPGSCVSRSALNLPTLVRGGQIEMWIWSDSGSIGVIFRPACSSYQPRDLGQRTIAFAPIDDPIVVHRDLMRRTPPLANEQRSGSYFTSPSKQPARGAVGGEPSSSRRVAGARPPNSLSCKRYAIAEVSNSRLIRAGGSVSYQARHRDFNSLMPRLVRAAISAEIRSA